MGLIFMSSEWRTNAFIRRQCVRHHCEGKAFMVGHGPFFCFDSCVHVAMLQLDPLMSICFQFSSAEFCFFLK